MNRLTSSALLAVATLAACGGSHKPTTPTAGGGAAVTIDLGALSEDFGVYGFDDHGALPAISADGTLVAALFHDEVDFVGMPVDTVVVWKVADGTRVGEAASNDGDPGDGDAAPVADPGRAAKATALLAGHTWIKVGATPAVTPHDQGEGVDIALGDGRTLRFAEGTFSLSAGAVTPTSFAAPGDGTEEVGGGGCGEIFGTKVLAAGADWLLVVPDEINLGGDSCFGKFGAELAQIIKLSK